MSAEERFDLGSAINEQLEQAATERREVLKTFGTMINDGFGDEPYHTSEVSDGYGDEKPAPMSVEVHANIVAEADRLGIHIPTNAKELADFMILASMDADPDRRIFE